MGSFTGRTGVTRGQLAQYQSFLPGRQNAFYQPLYDYQAYPTAGALNFNFFQIPQGQGTTSALGASGVKTLADTNMTNAGMLPLNNKFLCIGIEVEFWPGSTPGLNGTVVPTAAQFARNWDDVYNVLRSGSLTLTVATAPWAQDAPLMKFPPTSRLTGIAAYNENNSTATTVGWGQIEYAAACGAGYNITPVLLESTQNFNVQIAFPALVATPSTVDGRIGVRLVGKMVRAAQ